MRLLIYIPNPAVFKLYLPLCKMFRQHGWQVEVSAEEDECFTLLSSSPYGALLFITGQKSSQEIRTLHQRFRTIPQQALFGVITSYESYVERALCLNTGVDLYYISPFSYTQLLGDLAHKIHTRQSEQSKCILIGSFRLDLLARRAFFQEKCLNLTRIQFELLALFLRRRGSVLSRVQIWEEIWGFGDYPLANTIDVHVNRLRRQLADRGRLLIKTIYGVGYQIESDL